MERSREELIRFVEQYQVIAILRKVPMDAFDETVEALYRGGIRLMEVTFDPAGEMPEEETLEQIRRISGKYKEVLPGAGTVLTREQVRKAKEAGAFYMISPNTDREVIRESREAGVLSIPGAFTPSEAVKAHQWGADFVKLFPVGRLGSGYIKDITAPLPHIRFLAVGGVNEENMAEYLKAGCRGVGAAACLVNRKLIQERNFAELERRAEKLMACAAGRG